MAINDERTVAILQSDRFPYRNSGDDPKESPPGRDLAVFLMHEMSTRGFAPTFATPIQGEGGWHWDGDLDNKSFNLFVHWAWIGNPPRDCWVIQPDLRKGVLRTMFGKPARPDELAPICELLHSVLDHNAVFSSVQWLTDEEFRKVY